MKETDFLKSEVSRLQEENTALRYKLGLAVAFINAVKKDVNSLGSLVGERLLELKREVEP